MTLLFAGSVHIHIKGSVGISFQQYSDLNWTCCCILNHYLRDSLQVNDNSPALLYDEVSGCKKVSIQKVLPNLFQTLILSIPHSAPSWVEFVYSISSVCVCVWDLLTFYTFACNIGNKELFGILFLWNIGYCFLWLIVSTIILFTQEYCFDILYKLGYWNMLQMKLLHKT